MPPRIHPLHWLGSSLIWLPLALMSLAALMGSLPLTSHTPSYLAPLGLSISLGAWLTTPWLDALIHRREGVMGVLGVGVAALVAHGMGRGLSASGINGGVLALAVGLSMGGGVGLMLGANGASVRVALHSVGLIMAGSGWLGVAVAIGLGVGVLLVVLLDGLTVLVLGALVLIVVSGGVVIGPLVALVAVTSGVANTAMLVLGLGGGFALGVRLSKR